MFPEPRSNSVQNKLSVLKINAFIAKAPHKDEAPKKLSDGGGLTLIVSPTGTAVWRLKYDHGGSEKSYTIGRWPGVSLEEARKQRDVARTQLNEGIDPVAARRIRRAVAVTDNNNTFANACTVWLAKMKNDWKPIHYKISKRALEKDVLPRLGRLPVNEITPPIVAAVIEKIAERGVTETAHKVLHHCHCIFRLAVAKGWCKTNPAEAVSEVLPKRKPKKSMPAILEFRGLGDLLRRAETARLSPAVRMAHRLAAFTTARMGNVTLAEWSEFHLDEDPAVWIIPRHKMKAQNRHSDHKIVLSRHIVEELLEWRQVNGGEGFLFPTPTRRGTEPISREAVEKAYRQTLDLQGRHTPHGWRAAFSTLAKDEGFSRDAVELALDHIHDNDIVRAYDRGQRLTERIKLMNWWGDQLILAQQGGEPGGAAGLRVAV